MKKRMLCCLLALVLAVGLLSACGSGKAAVYVQSVAALTGYGSLGGANASSGVVVAQKEIKVERDSSRKVKQLNVGVGQEVKTGEVLFTYDMEDMQLTIDKAKLEIEQMKNNVKDLTSQISQLEKEKKSAPTSEQLSYTVQIQALEADKKEAEYNITVKQKELDAMTSGSGTANVTAPVDGKVQAINENGTDSSGNAAAYITLVQDGAYRVKGKINELTSPSAFPLSSAPAWTIPSGPAPSRRSIRKTRAPATPTFPMATAIPIPTTQAAPATIRSMSSSTARTA